MSRRAPPKNGKVAVVFPPTKNHRCHRARGASCSALRTARIASNGSRGHQRGINGWRRPDRRATASGLWSSGAILEPEGAAHNTTAAAAVVAATVVATAIVAPPSSPPSPSTMSTIKRLAFTIDSKSNNKLRHKLFACIEFECPSRSACPVIDAVHHRRRHHAPSQPCTIDVCCWPPRKAGRGGATSCRRCRCLCNCHRPPRPDNWGHKPKEPQ